MSLALEKTRICAGYLIRNLRTWIDERFGRLESETGASHRGRPVEESLDYIDRVFADYLRYSGEPPERLEGLRVLEVGPGDNYGVALRFLAAGAAQVVCLDRFRPVADLSQQQRIYEALGERLPPDQRARYVASARPETPEKPSPRLEPILGVSIERAAGRMPGQRFDWIVSRAVLEEVHDIAASFRSMDRLLEPGGLLLHKIDCRDYGIFRRRGFHPLEIYTIPDGLYRAMSRYEPIPKRRLPGDYLRLLDELGYESTLFYCHLAGDEREIEPHWPGPVAEAPGAREAMARVEEIRPRLARRFRGLPAEELAVGGFFLRARKPAERLNLPSEPG